MPKPSPWSRERLAGALAILLPAVVYAMTLYPGPGGRFNAGDSLKYQYLGSVLGVAHGPGNPQYVVLNYLWTLLPLPGSLALRVNALSLVLGLLALGLTFRLGLRLSRSPWAAMLATWVVAFGRKTWGFSTEAEVYTLDLVWVLIVVSVAIEWRLTRRSQWLAATLIAYSLSFGNHLEMITLLPALFLIVLGTEARVLRQPRWLLLGAISVIVGAAQYGFVWLRATQGGTYLEGLEPGWTAKMFMDKLLIVPHRSEFAAGAGWDDVLYRASGTVAGELASEMYLPALLLAVVGVALLWKKDWAIGGFLGLAIIGPAALAMLSNAGDSFIYVLPCYPLLGVAVAVALARAEEGSRRTRNLAYGGVVAGLLLALGLNSTALHVDSNRLDLSLLIDNAQAPAYIVSGRPSYESDQLRHYYYYGLKLDERGIEIRNHQEAFDQRLHLGDIPLYYADDRVWDWMEFFGADQVASSPAGTLGTWLDDLSPATPVAILITGAPSGLARARLAETLRPLGLGAALRTDTTSIFYSGIGRLNGTGVEVAHPDDAILNLTASEQPWLPATTMRLYAGQTAEGIRNELTVDGVADLSPRPGLRAFALDGSADRAFEVDLQMGTARKPRWAVTATPDPVDSLVVESGDRMPRLLRAVGMATHPVTPGQALVELAVIDAGTRRVKSMVGFDYRNDDDAYKDIRRLISSVADGDWVVAVVKSPPRRPKQERLAAEMALIGLTMPPASPGTYWLGVGRKGAAPLVPMRSPEQLGGRLVVPTEWPDLDTDQER